MAISFTNRYKKGRKHDYDVYKRDRPVTPSKEVVNVVDLGYLGVEKDYQAEQLSSALPCKKKRNQQGLSQEEIEFDSIYSKKKIVVEHTICRLKEYRIISDVFRNKLRKYDKVSYIVAGPVNIEQNQHH